MDSVLKPILQYGSADPPANQDNLHVDMNRKDRHFNSQISEMITACHSEIRRQQAELHSLGSKYSIEDVKSVLSPATSSATLGRQQSALTTTWEQLATASPTMPDPSSVVPTLLALEDVAKSIIESMTDIENAIFNMEVADQEFESDDLNYADAVALAEKMDARIAVLQSDRERRALRSSRDLLMEIIQSKQRRRSHLKHESQIIQATLDQFFSDHLASMIAVEESGGPVAGKAYGDGDTATKFSSSEARQQKLDDMWGKSTSPSRSAQQTTEELRALTLDLISALQGFSESGVYVPLERDSAIARFLIRAKVALYHPKDAKKLRLVDFSRELEV